MVSKVRIICKQTVVEGGGWYSTNWSFETTLRSLITVPACTYTPVAVMPWSEIGRMYGCVAI